MRRAIAIGVVLSAVACCATFIVMAAGKPAGFNGVVHSVESRYHVHASRIPFMGLASVIARKATHGGVSHVQIATIEDFTQTIDGGELSALTEANIGPGWSRMVRETRNPGNEQTLIYARPDGEKIEMLVVDLDSKEMDIVGVAIAPDYLSKFLKDHEHHASGEKNGEEAAPADDKSADSEEK